MVVDRVVPPRDAVLRFEVVLGGRTYQGDLETELRIETDPEGLNTALAENPSRFAWWATLETMAKAIAEEQENALNKLHANLYAQYAKAMEKPTVESLKQAIQRTEKYVQQVEVVRQAKRDAALLTVARQAMVQKKDSLLAVASNYRAELDARMRDQMSAIRHRIRSARGTA
jgi:hypothetical protein